MDQCASMRDEVSVAALQQSITALLTPQGPSALASIGILGPNAVAIVQRFFRPASADAFALLDESRHYFGRFGLAIDDDVVVRVRRVEESFEVQIHCHGGIAVVESILEAIESAGGVRVTWREYLAHRGLSETQIEAAEAMAACDTARAAAILLDQYSGALDTALERLQSTGDSAIAARLLELAPLGLHLANPWKVLFIGRTNVGKSSLLNALAGYERAIVSDQPGTTRDVVRVRMAIDGWPVELIDGAGFGETDDPLERQGRERLIVERRRVDLACMIADLSQPWNAIDTWLEGAVRPDLLVGNKLDLPSNWGKDERSRLAACCSARTGDGIPHLVDCIVGALVPHVPHAGEAVPFTPRQVESIRSMNRP